MDSQGRTKGSGKPQRGCTNTASHRHGDSTSLSKNKSAVREDMLVALRGGIYSLLCDSRVHSAVDLYASNARMLATHRDTKILKVALGNHTLTRTMNL